MTPDLVLKAALQARDEWRYDDVVKLVDVASRAERFQQFCEMMRAHWDANVLRTLPGIASYAELIALGASTFLSRWLANADYRAGIVQQLRVQNREVPEYLLGVPPGKEYVVIGSVNEGDDVVHVLYREVYNRVGEEPNRGQVEYEALRRQSDGSWRLLADDSSFLQHRGARVTILGDEFAELWDPQA